MIDFNGLKDVQVAMNKALELLQHTTEGLPERIAALKEVSKEDSENMSAAIKKMQDVMDDVHKQAQGIKV